MPAGRPTKYTKKKANLAISLAAKGKIDTEIAEALDITQQTLNNWKKKYPEFFESLKAAKKEVDKLVERSLLERALGYEHPDTHISNYKGEITITDITKHYPPEVTACIFWLKNRDPERWRDKQDIEHSGDIPISIVNYGDNDPS